ncbi:hypothetical protein ACFQ1E_17015 [Sphingomonas canadensis]|uniref:Uncharacterized protein n=1 Tax=Sphingomonas canadensis TaxID=1219257 RepID=A0ABW3HB66_9SPHN|nr:hypothetical protein [Sphingomonas canadensis]MCW3837748.1 hypothetical protein [Sphingomonas canadensis]
MISLVLAAILAPVMPQEAPAPEDPPKRIRNIILFGEETCPASTDPDEIVVCAKGGDSPYRIPKEFRDQPSDRPDGVAWGRRAEIIEEVNRVGLPNSCSPVGSGGQTGCTRSMIEQWARERLERRVREANIP